MNVIFMAGFGRRFESVNDPEFVKLSEMVEYGMKLAGLENDLANFLPIISIVDYFAGTQLKMKQFVKTKRDPVYKQLIEEAATREGPNLVKSLAEDGFDLSDDEKIVFMCMYIID